MEAHPSPEKAISDGAQSLDLTQFSEIMEELSPYVELSKGSRESAWRQRTERASGVAALVDRPQQNYIARDFAATQEELFSVQRPVEVEDLAGSECRQLPGFSAGYGLLPKIRRLTLREEILQTLPVD